MPVGIKHSRITYRYLVLSLVVGFTLFAALIGAVGDSIAHESPPVVVELSANQNRAVQLQVKLELEKYMPIWQSNGADEHSEAVEAGYENLRELPPKKLEQKFRTASLAGFTPVVLISERGREIPLTLDSVDIDRQSGALNRRITTVSFSAILAESESGLRLRASMQSVAIIVNYGASDRQQSYVPPGNQSAQINLLSNVIVNPFRLFTDYLVAGFSHIVPKGFDHALFMLALVLLAQNWKILAMQVSLFTLAHSVTLAFGVFGLVKVPAAVVEPLIAASIIYVCVENLRGAGNNRFRGIVIFTFGLLHGLGFASVLATAGLQTGALVQALIAFNLGIELAQLGIVLVFSVVIRCLHRYKIVQMSTVGTTTSLALGIAGTFLFVERVLQ